jgi:hypothetical protein
VYQSGRPLLVAVGLLGIVSVSAAAAQDGPIWNLGESGANLVYTPLTPCRIIDTRIAGGLLTPGAPRSFFVVGTAGFETQGGLAGGCGVPTSATAVMINFVAVDPAGPGNLRAFPFGQSQPLASIINYAAISGLALANGVLVPTCDHSTAACTFDITIQANASATQLVADVFGYFGSTGSVITGVDAGTGLSGGGTSGSVTLSVDGAVTQLRVDQSCAVGSSIRAINEDGTVACQADTNSGGTVTSVSAGSGLLGGTITGAGTISASFAGSGVANTIARSDHTHAQFTPTTQTKSIRAVTCVAQSGAVSGDSMACGSSDVVRTDGDTQFPCVVRARPARDTWLCALDLPPGSRITNITAYGFDLANDGYMEALVWRFDPTQVVGFDGFSNFGGTWQSSGTPFAGGQVSFPVFSAATPHTVSGNHHYVIGLGMKSPTGQTVWAQGFLVTYMTP